MPAVSTLLGTDMDVDYVSSSSSCHQLDYPDETVEHTIGQIYSQRLYARGLTALEIASSGKIAFSPGDKYAFDVERSGSNVSITAESSDAFSMRVVGPSNTSHVEMTRDGNLTLQADSNVYIRCQTLVIDVQNLLTTYSFLVNPRGELELVQKLPSQTPRTVARFGCKVL